MRTPKKRRLRHPNYRMTDAALIKEQEEIWRPLAQATKAEASPVIR